MAIPAITPLLDVPDKVSSTVLTFAFYSSKLEISKNLIEKYNADITKRNNIQNHLSHAAVSTDHPEFFDYLMSFPSLAPFL